MKARKSLFCCCLHCKYTKCLLRFSCVQTPGLQQEPIPSLHLGTGITCRWRVRHTVVSLWYLPGGRSPSYPSAWNIPIASQNTENLEDVKMGGRIWERESWVTFLAQPSAHFVVSGKPSGCLSMKQVKYFRCYSQMLNEGLHYYCNKLL